MDRPMCSALLRFGSFPHHNEVGAKVIYTKYSKHSNETNTFMGLCRAGSFGQS